MKIIINTKIIVTIATALLLPIVLSATANALGYHVNCDQCHLLHSGPGSNLLYEVNSETVCMSCHDGSVSDAPEASIHEEQNSEFLASCVDCHDTHSNKNNYEGGVNISLVGISYDLDGDYNAKIMSNNDDSGELFNVAFEESREFWRSSPRTDSDNGRRVCQVCHTVPEFRNHPMSSDCTNNCHKHADGFMRIGSGPGM
jgi:predicted CXXCH cytochrome family protein